MDKQTIQELVNLLGDMKQSEWVRVKRQVDLMFSHEAAKVKLGDTTQLQQNLEVGFNLRRFGEKSD